MPVVTHISSGEYHEPNIFVRRALSAVLVLAFVLALGVPFAAAQDGEGRVVTDFLGREVTIAAPPERVVGLSVDYRDVSTPPA